MEYLIVELDKNNPTHGILAYDTPEYFGNNIRLWKLGDHKRNIYPTKDAVENLLDILKKVHESDGITDIVWDTMIECEVFGPTMMGKAGDEVFFVSDPNRVIEIDDKTYSLVHRNNVALIRSKQPLV